MHCLFGVILYFSFAAFFSVAVQTRQLQSNIISAEGIEKNLRVISPLLQVIDNFAIDHDRETCMEKMFCILESNFPADVHNPLKFFGRLLINSKTDMDAETFSRVKSLIKKSPHLARVVSGIEAGQKVKDTNQCDTLFPECKVALADIAKNIYMLDDQNLRKPALVRAKRNGISKACVLPGVACGAVAIGCVVCGIFSLGTCFLGCTPVGAALCGAGGIACGIAG